MKKKLYLILIILLSQVLLTGQEKIDINNKNDRETWNKLTEQERWESFVIEHNAYIELKKIYDNAIIREETILEEYEKTNEILKKKWSPRSGVSMNILGGMNERIKIDVFVNIAYICYIFNSRVFITPSFYVKIYDEIGGGIGFGLGFNW